LQRLTNRVSQFLEFGNDAVDGFEIKIAAHFFRHKQMRHIALAQDILDLGGAVIRIHRHEHRADFGQCKFQQNPFRHVERPDRYVFALLNAEREQPLSDTIDGFAVLAITPAQVQANFRVAVHEGFLIGEFRRTLIEQIANRLFKQSRAEALGFPMCKTVFDSHRCSRCQVSGVRCQVSGVRC
jgi:hypothetical protein